MSAPPTDSSKESSLDQRTLLTLVLWPRYFLNLANWPCRGENHLQMAAGRRRTDPGGRTAPHPGREAEELQEAKVVSARQELAVLGERGGVDQAERRPDSLTGRTQDAGPAGPVQLLKLGTRGTVSPGPGASRELTTLTSCKLMFCLRPRGASKNSCSLAPVLTCSSLPERSQPSSDITTATS